jgi:hypothetical protein
MSCRRVLLCLPETPSEDVLEIARVVKAALVRENHQVHLRVAGEGFDGDVTPVDTPRQPLILWIAEPPDGGESVM